MAGSFQLNSPPVVLETVDEETIIVNLDTGSYYDLNHSGGRLLEAVGRGVAVEAAVDAVAAQYGVERDRLAGPAQDLVAQMIEEGILVDGGNAEGSGAELNGSASPGKPYEQPKLSKYTDMQELLLLDPVHEVDGAGWPNKV